MLRVFVLGIFLIGGGCFTGCGGANSPSIKPGAAMPGLNLSGHWFSPEFGELKIIHSGASISGRYEDRRGPDHSGRFRGFLEGDLVRLEWIKPGKPAAAIMPRRGKAWLRVVDRGGKLMGRWGFDQSDDDGGPWTAEKTTSDR